MRGPDDRRPPIRNPMHAQRAAAAQPPAVAKPVAATPAIEKPHKDRGPITLAQFLKLVGVAENGGHAKVLIREGQVMVNGQAELRPARKLAKGDRVTTAGAEHLVDR
ncbi:MAG: RNA-binding S4 domain-containing protein [Planctomycetota bacterium]